jgi:rubrerythrin
MSDKRIKMTKRERAHQQEQELAQHVRWQRWYLRSRWEGLAEVTEDVATGKRERWQLEEERRDIVQARLDLAKMQLLHLAAQATAIAAEIPAVDEMEIPPDEVSGEPALPMLRCPICGYLTSDIAEHQRSPFCNEHRR